MKPEIFERQIAHAGYLTVERLRMGLPMALRSRARWSGMGMPLRCCPTMLSDAAHSLCAFSVRLFLWHQCYNVAGGVPSSAEA
jgi:hypothetical protein